MKHLGDKVLSGAPDPITTFGSSEDPRRVQPLRRPAGGVGEQAAWPWSARTYLRDWRRHKPITAGAPPPTARARAPPSARPTGFAVLVCPGPDSDPDNPAAHPSLSKSWKGAASREASKGKSRSAFPTSPRSLALLGNLRASSALVKRSRHAGPRPR